MTDARIRLAFFLAFGCILFFSISLALGYFGVVYGFFSVSAARIVTVVSTVALAAGIFVFVFGFVAPVLGRFVFENILSEKKQAQVLRFRIWRFLLSRDESEVSVKKGKENG